MYKGCGRVAWVLLLLCLALGCAPSTGTQAVADPTAGAETLGPNWVTQELGASTIEVAFPQPPVMEEQPHPAEPDSTMTVYRWRGDAGLLQAIVRERQGWEGTDDELAEQQVMALALAMQGVAFEPIDERGGNVGSFRVVRLVVYRSEQDTVVGSQSIITPSHVVRLIAHVPGHTTEVPRFMLEFFDSARWP